MKRTRIVVLIALALASALLLGGCLSLKPFTQEEIEQIRTSAVSSAGVLRC